MKRKTKKINWIILAFTLVIAPIVIVPTILLSNKNNNNQLISSNQFSANEIVIDNQPNNTSVPQGKEAYFEIELNPEVLSKYKNQFSFQWYETTSLKSNSGILINNQTSRILKIQTSSYLANTKKYYYCVIKVKNYIKQSKIVVLDVTQSPGIISIEKQPTSQLANLNQSIVFSVNASIPNPILGKEFTYQWYETDVNKIAKKILLNETNNNLIIKVNDSYLNSKKYYYCEISYFDAVTVESNIAILYTNGSEQKTSINIDAQPSDKNVFVKSNASISFISSISNPIYGEQINYQWYETNKNNDSSNQKIIDGLKNPSALTQNLIIDAKENDVAGIKYYFCKISYATLTKDTEIVSLSVSSLNDISILTQPQPVSVGGAKKDWYFMINAIPNVPIEGEKLHYQWYRDDVLIPDEIKDYIHVTDGSNYYCEISYAFSNTKKSNIVKIGGGLSSEIIKFVSQPTNATISINTPNTFNFIVNATTAGWIPFPSGFTIYYQWFETKFLELDSSGIPLDLGTPILNTKNNYVGASSKNPITLTIPETLNNKQETKYYYCMLATTNGNKIYYSNIVSLTIN